MKKFRIKWTSFASRCLEEIYLYLKNRERSETPALKLMQRLIECVEQLQDFPESGSQEELLKVIGQKSRYLV